MDVNNLKKKFAIKCFDFFILGKSEQFRQYFLLLLKEDLF